MTRIPETPAPGTPAPSKGTPETDPPATATPDRDTAPEHTPELTPEHTPWIVRAEREVLSRPPFLRVVQQTVEIGGGVEIDDFYQVHLRDFALCVPVLETGAVQVIRQYKHGPGRVCLGFPAGYVDPGEAPDMAAKRELLEETGLAARGLTPLGSFVDNGNQRGCRGHYFLGTGCTRVAAPDHGDLEHFEYLEMTPAEIESAMMRGDFAVIHHVAAWGLARLHRA